MTATDHARVRASFLRRGEGADRVTNVELFFDLVYVFAITQLSHVLLAHLGLDGAVQTAVLLAMVWQVWIYTTWGTTFVDPRRISVRVMLLVLMAAGLVLSSALPEAFSDAGTDRGMVVAVAYAAMQVGRPVFLVAVLREHRTLQVNFVRILVWCLLSSGTVLAGAFVHGHARELLWALGVGFEVAGAAVGFPVPGLGHSRTSEWTVRGGHFAERCQAFVLIALGESVVVIGATLSSIAHPDATELVAVAAAFAGSIGFWWVYFDRAADDSAARIEASEDPGRLARSAFHWVHPLLVAGIVVSAAADEKILEHPTARGELTTAWLVLGSTALFLFGHALFKLMVWRAVSWVRVSAVVVLLALVPVGRHLSALVLGSCALAALVVVAIVDRLTAPPPELELQSGP